MKDVAKVAFKDEGSDYVSELSKTDCYKQVSTVDVFNLKRSLIICPADYMACAANEVSAMWAYTQHVINTRCVNLFRMQRPLPLSEKKRLFSSAEFNPGLISVNGEYLIVPTNHKTNHNYAYDGVTFHEIFDLKAGRVKLASSESY